MAELSLTPQAMIAKYPTLPVTPNAADFTWTTAGADFADGAAFTMTGNQVLLVRNDNVGAQTITIQTVADDFNRTGNITAYSIGAAEFAAFPALKLPGWRQSDGKYRFAASATDVFFAVLTLPE